MYKILFLAGLFTITLFISCKKDVQLNDEWSENMIIYGLIDIKKDTQYIKIYKSFIGNNDAYEMAKISDSSYYPYKLDGRIEIWDNNRLNKTLKLDTINLPNLNSGIFGSSNNHAYYFILDNSYEYNQNTIIKLYIKNPVTGKEVSSETKIVTPFSFTNTSGYQSEIGLYNNNKFSDISMSWYSSKNSQIHEAYIRFYFLEINNISKDTTEKYIDWQIGQYYSNNAEEELKKHDASNSASTFFEYIKNNLSINANISRLPGTLKQPEKQLELIVDAAGKELSTYIEITKPSNSIVQSKPIYTNINNGFGIFSSIYSANRYFKINKISYNYLSTDSQLKSLNFMPIPTNRQ